MPLLQKRDRNKGAGLKLTSGGGSPENMGGRAGIPGDRHGTGQPQVESDLQGGRSPAWPGGRRFLAAVPQRRRWTIRADHRDPRDGLYAEILASGMITTPDAAAREAVCLDTAMLGDTGRRLAATGINRILVLADPGSGEGSILIVENPDPALVPLGVSTVPGVSGVAPGHATAPGVVAGAGPVHIQRPATASTLGVTGLLDQLRPRAVRPVGRGPNGSAALAPSLSDVEIPEVWALRRWTNALFNDAARPVHRQQGPLELVRQLGVDVAVVLSPCPAGLRATWASTTEIGEQTFDGFEAVAALGHTDSLGPILASVMSSLMAPPRAPHWQFAWSSFGPLVLAVSPAAPHLATALELVADFLQCLEERFAVEYESRANTMLVERARIAAMIHDSVTQQVTNVSTQLQLLEVVAHDPARFQQMLREARSQVGEALDELRRSIYDLVPNGPGGEDLVRGVRRFLEGYVAQWGLDVRFASRGAPVEVGPEQSGLIFSFVQECLTNVRKHAGARTARVGIEFGDAGLVVRVSDDGSGFDEGTSARGQTGSHLGLHLLKTRADLLAATLNVRSARGQGTTVELALPGPV